MRRCDEGNRQQPTSCRAILQWDRGFESVFPQRRVVQTIGSSAVDPRGVSALQILGRFSGVVHGIALGHPNVREPKSAGTGRTYVKTKSIGQYSRVFVQGAGIYDRAEPDRLPTSLKTGRNDAENNGSVLPLPWRSPDVP